MNKCLSCEFNIDTGNVECRFTDGTLLSIDCDAVESISKSPLFQGANRIGLARVQRAKGLCTFFSMAVRTLFEAGVWF